MAEKKIVEFEGYMVKTIFDSEDYKIYGFNVDFLKYPQIKFNKYSNVTIVGNTPTLDEGIDYKIKAEEQQGKHGIQYKVISIRRDKPKTDFSVRLFLAEILDSSSQVNEIMNNYPDIIDRVINNRLDDVDLSKLYNIGEYRFNVIKRKIIENFALAELVDEFKGFIEFKILKILLDKYGSIENIKEKLQENPYKCLCGLSRIAFKSADKILVAFNEECKKIKDKGEEPPIDFTFDLLTSPQRQKAAIMFLLQENETEGNTRISIKTLRKQSEAIANKCVEHFVDLVKNDEDIHFDKKTMTVALKETFETEKYIADRILEGQKINNKWQIKDVDYTKIDGMQLTDEQIKTIPMICENNICILKGGAGTGKSSSTKAAIKMFKDNNKSFVIFAPTGRASKVISDFTKENAYTIHRGLGYIPPEWTYNENNKLPYDIVVVDETSMTDVFLMKRLIEAIDFNTTKLLFIGDENQIPSVGAGNVFYDLIHSGIIPTNTLTKIFRYGKGGILTVATKTRNCEKWLSDSNQPQVFGEDKGYTFIPTPQEKIVDNVIALYKKLLSKGYSQEDIMILSAYNIGEYGTVNLNKHLQPIANPNVKSKGNYIVSGETTFYEGDMVIQTVNNYKAKRYNEDWMQEEKELFIPNGEIGQIVRIEYNTVIIKFDDYVSYSKEQLTQIKLAYSISTHKSQGGQARVVILITPKAHTFMLNSNLIYVGQTRAKERVFHFGELTTVNRSIKKKADFNRETYLMELLQKNIDKFNQLDYN